MEQISKTFQEALTGTGFLPKALLVQESRRGWRTKIKECIKKQSRNRDTDLEIKHMDIKGERWGWDKLGDWDWYIYTIDTADKIDN